MGGADGGAKGGGKILVDEASPPEGTVGVKTITRGTITRANGHYLLVSFALPVLFYMRWTVHAACSLDTIVLRLPGPSVVA